jgi:hypothetical protein
MAFVDNSAPPSEIVPECKYGEYCIKSEVAARLDMHVSVIKIETRHAMIRLWS